VPNWRGHQAGQHVDVRLTAADGYQAERSYSIASPPEEAPRVTLTIERLDDGEVSPYLTEELRVGDKLELRGPIGGYFVWEASMGGPLLLVAGGAGIVRLMAMLRHRAAVGGSVANHVRSSSGSVGRITQQYRTTRADRSSIMSHKLDVNVAGGVLQAIFPFDMTLAQTTCAGCGATNAIGVTAVYMHGMGTVIRCPSCDTVLIRVAQ